MKDNKIVWFNGGVEALTVSQKQIYQAVVKALPISHWFTHIKGIPRSTFESIVATQPLTNWKGTCGLPKGHCGGKLWTKKLIILIDLDG